MPYAILVESDNDYAEEDFRFRQCILFRTYLAFERGVTFHFNKLEFPLSKDALCQV